LLDWALAPVVHLQSPPQEQSWPHWQFMAFDPQLQEGPQLQALLLHSFVI